MAVSDTMIPANWAGDAEWPAESAVRRANSVNATSDPIRTPIAIRILLFIRIYTRAP